jgi:hypothetical protein
MGVLVMANGLAERGVPVGEMASGFLINATSVTFMDATLVMRLVFA